MPILKKKNDKAQTATCSYQSSSLKNTLKSDKTTKIICADKKFVAELTSVSTCPFKAAVLNSFADDRSFSETFHNKSVKVY